MIHRVPTSQDLPRNSYPRDYDGDWKRTVNSGDENIPKTKMTAWFDQVYEKKKVVPPAGGGTK
ncbi:hypothetical protein P7H19_24700 [Paenibacillus larvae]|nr:hypothetical protein [Paenibacillus larvae]MDT2238835.1 hypothetical protein [Paenibacillus larvae]